MQIHERAIDHIQDDWAAAIAGVLFNFLDTIDLIAYGIKNRSDTTTPAVNGLLYICLLYTSPSPRDRTRSRMPSSA